MPPKPTGKKGDVEDFSDASSLPQANIFKFTIVHKHYFAQEQRDRVRTSIKDKLLPSGAGKIQTLSRDDITTYGKAKMIIMDAAQMNALPADDNRKNLSELDMVARSAADRLFELSVLIRRQKQARGANQDETDDNVDGYIFMPDYPTTRAEIMAFSKYSQALNAVFEIEEVAPQADEDDEDIKGNEKPTTPDSEDARKSAIALLAAFRSARAECDPRSGLRQLALLKFPFVNQPVQLQTTEGDGSVSIKHRSAEDNFVIELIQKGIDKFAQYFVQYCKFKKIVALQPLVPDRASLDKIEELKREQKRKHAWLQDAAMEHEAAIKELEASKVGEDDREELLKTDKEINDQTVKFTAAKEQTETRLGQITTEMQDLMRRSKQSLDDKDKSTFSLKAYANDFVDNPETSNNISSMLSAMITHIDALSKPEVVEKSEESTAGETNIDEMFESFAFDIACDLGLKDRGPDPVTASFHDTISSFNYINPAIKIDEETNKSLNVKQNVPAAVLEVEEQRLNQIAKREQIIFQHLRVPGKQRDCMPKVPHQSERIRAAENPAFYPFCTLPVDEAERLLQLRAFQQMIKSNYIDQGQKGIEKHTKYQIFERCFENHMDMNIFSQCFADALLDDPEVASMYYPRTDSLLIAMFNKVKQPSTRPQKEEKFRHVSADLGLDTKDADGEKQWRAAYRVMPDFENWIIVFADEIIQEQEIIKPQKQETLVPETSAPAKPNPKDKANVADAVDPHALPVTLMKYVLDEEALPKTLVNVEDARIQIISEKSALMYPDDNSVMRVDHFQIGGQHFSKSIVIKDNLRFGLRQQQRAQIEHTEYGLVRQIPVGDTEFYLHFENGTKMGVEQCQMQRNPQKLIKVMPPLPTQQEIDFKLEQIKKYQEAALKAQKTNKPLVTDIEIPKTPQPTWESQPLNYLDSLYSDEDMEQCHALTTLTFKNGLIVQVLGNGHILQTHERNLNITDEHAEIDRLCTQEGIVIRQFKNLDVEMLFPDGVHAGFSRSKLQWIVTNNKGMQRSFKDGVFTDLKAIPCAVETDAVTGAKMLIREDEIIIVTYQDGSSYCQHRDGTKFHTSADGQEIRVEKRNFASHCVKLSGDSHLAGPLARALDHRVLETYLPDGSRAQTFLDQTYTKKKEQVEVYRTIISRSDLSVIFADSLGHVSICSSNTRDALNDLGAKKKIGVTDDDFYQELDREHGQFMPQVYQVHVSSKQGKSQIKTKNFFNNTIFKLNCNMTLSKLMNAKQIKQNSFKKSFKNDKKSKQQKSAEPKSAETVMDIDVEETGQFVEPTMRSFVYPRFFIVDSQGKAKELLTKLQLSYQMRQKGLQPLQSIKQKMAEVFNNQFVENIYFLTKVINMEQILQQQQALNSIELPENARDALKGKIDVPDILLLVPRQQQYLFNQIFKMPDCDSFNQQAFANDYQRYIQWRLENVRYETEFGLIYAPTTKDAKIDWEKVEDDQFFNKRIGIKILKSRAQPRQKFAADDFKQGAMRDMAQSQSIKAFTQSNLNSLGQTMNSIASQKVNPKYQLEITRKPQVSKSTKETILQQNRVNKKLETLNLMKAADDFIPEYFETQEGQLFTQENPPKPLSQEAMIRMQQRLQRQQRSQFQANDQAFDSQPAQQSNNEADEGRDNPIVALEPDELKQGSHFTGSRKDRSMIGGEKLSSVEIAQLPSLYKQEKMYISDKEQEQLLKAEEHHIVKTKDFNVYGRLREEKPFVKTIVKSSAQSELNEKFITTECITDRRVRISSQAPRFYMNAPSVEDVRKQGQHQMILSAIEKKQTFGELINQANSMVTGVLHDSLKRSLQVMPGSVVFGHIRPDTINEIIMSIKNEDSVPHRITIKPMADPRIVVRQEEYGIIAPGMMKQINVSIRLGEDVQNCIIKDTIQIVSKHDIFKIPVSATVVQAGEFTDLDEKQMMQTGKSIQNSRVRERIMSKIQESKQSPGPVVLTQMPNKLNDAGSDFGEM